MTIDKLVPISNVDYRYLSIVSHNTAGVFKKQVSLEPFDMFINPCVTGAVLSNNRWFMNGLR